jgi:hypothetical protein
MKVLLSLFLILLSVTLDACKARGLKNDLKHEIDHPINDNDPSQWSNVTSEDVGLVLAGYNPSIQSHYLAALRTDGDPIVVGLQAQVDKIFLLATQGHDTKTQSIPKPRIYSFKDNQVNVHAMSVWVALPQVPKLNGQELPLTGRDFYWTSIDRDHAFRYLAASKVLFKSQLESYFATSFWKNVESPDCLQFDVGKQKALDFPKKCPMPEEIYPVAVRTVGNSLIVHDGFLQRLQNPVGLVFSLAHEMGHYLKAHSLHPKKYSYLYHQGPRAMPGKPVPDPGLVDFQNRLNEASLIVKDYLELLQKTQIDANPFELIFLTQIIGFVKDNSKCGTDRDCQAKCQPAFDVVKDSRWQSYFTFGLEPARRSIVESLAKELSIKGVSCLSGIELRQDVVGSSVSSPMSHAFLTREELSRVVQIDVRFLHELKELKEPTITLSDAMRQVVASKKVAIETAQSVLEEADSKKFGWYTVEQEADELAVEWMVALGYSKQEILAGVESVFRLEESQRVPLVHKSNLHRLSMGPTMDECKRLIAGDSNIVVSPYQFYDAHHSGCYRYWNILREFEAHALEYRQP